LYRIPSIAASIQGHSPVHYDDAAAFIVKLAATVIEKGLPSSFVRRTFMVQSIFNEIRYPQLHLDFFFAG